MRKILFSLFALVVLFSCKEEEVIPEIGYPTDGLVLKEEQNLLLHLSAEPQPAYASLGANQTAYDKLFPNRVITTSSFRTGPLQTYFADSLARRLGASGISLYLNMEDALGILPDEIEKMLNQKPFLSVAHKGGQNDTAWYTDVKMKFYRDTNSSFIYVNSYLLSDFTAQSDTGGFDLTLPAFKDFVSNVNGISYHDRDYTSFDGETKIVSKGDVITLKDVVLYANPHFLQRGVNIAQEINPFKSEFFAGDVLGTESTAIRIYIKKPEDIDETLERWIKPKFLTIAWTADLENGGWKILNVFQGS